MDSPDSKVTRRSFLKLTVLFASGLAFGRQLLAAAKSKVSESNVTATALGYRHDAAKVDVAKFPTAKDAVKNGNICKNCMFYKADVAEKAWGECTLFPQNLVAQGGWCMSYAKKKS